MDQTLKKIGIKICKVMIMIKIYDIINSTTNVNSEHNQHNDTIIESKDTASFSRAIRIDK